MQTVSAATLTCTPKRNVTGAQELKRKKVKVLVIFFSSPVGSLYGVVRRSSDLTFVMYEAYSTDMKATYSVNCYDHAGSGSWILIAPPPPPILVIKFSY